MRGEMTQAIDSRTSDARDRQEAELAQRGRANSSEERRIREASLETREYRDFSLLRTRCWFGSVAGTRHVQEQHGGTSRQENKTEHAAKALPRVDRERGTST